MDITVSVAPTGAKVHSRVIVPLVGAWYVRFDTPVVLASTGAKIKNAFDERFPGGVRTTRQEVIRVIRTERAFKTIALPQTAYCL